MVKCPKLFVSPEDFSADELLLSGKEAHYLHRVLRLKPGDQLEICDGTRDYLIRLTACNRKAVQGTVIESRSLDTPDGIEIILAFSTVRPGPVQDILRHGTELGVSCFVPILSLRANRRPQVKKDRWSAIVASASAQSRRSIMPEIEAPVTLDRFIEQDARRNESRLLLSISPEATPILAALEALAPRKVAILSGPEGGMDPSEEKKAIDAGFQPVSLGRGILRSETAAVVAAGTILLWNDWLRFRCSSSTQEGS